MTQFVILDGGARQRHSGRVVRAVVRWCLPGLVAVVASLVLLLLLLLDQRTVLDPVARRVALVAAVSRRWRTRVLVSVAIRGGVVGRVLVLVLVVMRCVVVR